jgi:hypothetical protein
MSEYTFAELIHKHLRVIQQFKKVKVDTRFQLKQLSILLRTQYHDQSTYLSGTQNRPDRMHTVIYFFHKTQTLKPVE